MDLSPGLELVWNLAGREAVNVSMKEIEPEHFFCALLKFAELNDDELKAVASHPLGAKILAVERDQIRAILKERALPTTRARHQLRQLLGHGNYQHTGGSIHRSQAARQFFDRAIQIVRDPQGLVESPHLLQALLERPTPALAQALKAVGSRTASAEPAETKPLLDRWTQDVLQLAKQTRSDLPAAALPQAQVLGHALESSNAEPLLLVCEPRVSVLPIVAHAARELKTGRRIARVDLAAIRKDAPAEKTFASHITDLFAQAAGMDELVMLVDAIAEETHHIAPLLSALKPMLSRARVILALSASAYHPLIEADQALDDVFRTIWLHDLTQAAVPVAW